MYRLTRYAAALLAFGLLPPDLRAQTPASPTFLDLHVGGTLSLTGAGATHLNQGTTAQRPDSGSAGSVRYNTDTGRYEFGIGSAWSNHVRLDGDTMTGRLILNKGLRANLFSNGLPPIAGNFYVGADFGVSADSAVTTNPQATYWAQIAGNVGQPAWAALADVLVGVKWNNGGNIYIVTQSGTTGNSGGPVGTGSGITDGSVVWDYVSSDFTGPRSALALTLNIRSRTGPGNAGGLDQNWPTAIITFQSSANQGGTSPVSGSSAGQGYAAGDQAWLLSGATNWSTLTGREVDVGIFTGASSKSRYGLNVVSFGDLPANVDDQGIAIQGRTIGFKKLIRLGESSMTAADAIIQYFPRPQGALNGATYTNPVVARGIDLSNLAFSTAAFLAPGNGGIDGNGYVFSGAVKLSTSTTAGSLDAVGSIVSAVTSFATGNSFKVGDQLYDPTGTGLIITVNSIDGNGKPATWTITRAGGVLGATPTNPITLAGGSGTNSNVNLTWARVSKLSLNPSGGVIQTGSGTWSVNGSVATVLTSVGPTGSHTNVQEWFTITDGAGVVRYIPAY